LGILRDPLGPPGYRGDINCWRNTRTEKNWSIIFSRTEHKSFMVHPADKPERLALYITPPDGNTAFYFKSVI